MAQKTQTWSSYLSSFIWTPPPPKPWRPTDAMHAESVRSRFSHKLDRTEPPKSFKASDLAAEFSFAELQSMGYRTPEELVPAIIELAFEMRAFGYCDVLKGGKVVPEDVAAWEIEGGIRVRRRDG